MLCHAKHPLIVKRGTVRVGSDAALKPDMQARYANWRLC